MVSSRERDSAIRRKSLGELCEIYWYPLFAYLRRKGHDYQQAADYVQSFFTELIEKDFLDAVSPEKGHFRWFLMSAIKRHVAKQVEKAQAQKRGGDRQILSLNFDDAEKRYQLEPVDGWSAEKLYDRRWALEVLQQALERLEAEQEQKGKLELYRALQPTLAGTPMTGNNTRRSAKDWGCWPVPSKSRHCDCVRNIVTRLAKSWLKPSPIPTM